MRKLRTYEEHAADCRFLALSLKGEQREAMEDMAETWERLAKDRAELLKRHPDWLAEDEGDETPPRP